MNTVVTDSPEEAASYLREGEAVAFPTETVYGLGADAFDPNAVRKIFEAKGRPPANPLIVHIAEAPQIEHLAASVTDSARLLIERFFPGPLTVVLRKQPSVPDIVTAGLDTVGIRMPAHPMAQAFLRAAARPVAAPSANVSGRPSPTTWEAVHADLDGRIRCILRGPQADAGLESTVVDCTGERPILLRPGAVAFEELLETVPGIRLPDGHESLLARSPGTRFRHYRPTAQVHIVGRPPEAPPERSAYIGLEPPSEPGRYAAVRLCPNVEAYAHDLFAFFRSCDAQGIAHIFCQAVPAVGIGRALADRLERAASS